MTDPALEASLDVDVGDAVDFTLVVTNAGVAPVGLSFRTGQTADVVVLADGETVWRWSAGRSFTQALREERLEPGEAMRFEARWDDPEPGRYEAVARLAAQGIDAVARARFSA